MNKIYFDGATEPRNPGGAMGYGIVVKKDGNTVHTCSWYVKESPTNTNNIAEYKAFIEALNYIKRNSSTEYKIFGDSMMVVKQMNGLWGIKAGAYTPYALEARELLTEVCDLVKGIEWIPREQNSEADEASKAELSAHGIVPKVRKP